jgi:hypothetical protein
MKRALITEPTRNGHIQDNTSANTNPWMTQAAPAPMTRLS